MKPSEVHHYQQWMAMLSLPLPLLAATVLQSRHLIFRVSGQGTGLMNENFHQAGSMGSDWLLSTERHHEPLLALAGQGSGVVLAIPVPVLG